MKLNKRSSLRSQQSCLINAATALTSSLLVKRERFSPSIKRVSSLKDPPTKQALFLNQNGISILAPMILSMVFSLGILHTYKAIRINQVIRERKQVYLCLKESEFKKRSYLKKMGHLNKLVHAAFLARAIPPISPYAKRVQQAAQNIQLFIHISELKNAMSFKNCSSLFSLSYLRTLPYKTKSARLVRRLDGTTALKKKKWKEYLWSSNKNIILQSSLKVSSRFSSKFEIKRKEFSKEALLNLKESYGQAFSFSY